MDFDMRSLAPLARYKLITSTVTPRPIAWVTTVSKSGVVNVAPHSFFNAVGDDPPLVVLGLLNDAKSGGDKDTARNIAETEEFTIGLVSEADAQKMNLTSASCPPDVSEAEYAGISTTPSKSVRPPWISSCPVAFECRLHTRLAIGKQSVVLGEILVTHVADMFVSDPERMYLDTPAMQLVARLHGSGWYARTTDRFKLERPTYDPDRVRR